MSGTSDARRAVLATALHAAIAWTAYAWLEWLAGFAVPLAARGAGVAQAELAALPLLLHPLRGLLLGAVAGLPLAAPRLRGRAPALAPALGALTLPISYLVELRQRFHSADSAAALALAGLLAAGLVVRVLLPRAPRWLEAATGPIAVAVGLVGVSYVSVQPLPVAEGALRAAAAIAAAAAGMVGLALAVRGARAPRRTLMRLALLCGAGLVFSAVAVDRPAPLAPGPARARAGRPDVVLIVLDTVRADHLSLYGYGRETTPNLERLAEHASVYDHVASPGDFTLSSHASLFTGLYPRSHGAVSNGKGHPSPLPSTLPTLAGILSARGWLSFGVAANHAFFGAGFGLERGFQHFETLVPLSFHLLTTPERASTWLRPGLLRRLGRVLPRGLQRRFVPAAQVKDAALSLVDAAGERPFLLFCNFMDTHWPYLPPPPWNDLFPGRDPDFDEHHMGKILIHVVDAASRDLSERERAHLTSQYDGAIAYLDHQVGALLDALDARGLLDGALVVVTSDHGEALGARRLVGHGLGVHQDEVHVPLVVKLPGQRRGERVEARASLVDVLPTVLDVLGVPAPPGLQGLPLREAVAREDRVVVSESYPKAFPSHRFDRIQRALFRGSFKLIESTKGEREVYDLASDPHERDNLLPEHREQLEGALARWIAETPASSQRAEVTEEQLEHLRELGYVRDP